jgi:hypothetical protein
MARPAGGYRLADGTRVPGVTTILGKFKDPGALMFWAWKQGQDGKDFRDTSATACTTGNIVHDMIEANLLRQIYTPPTAKEAKVSDEELIRIMGAADKAFAAFLEWREGSRLEIIATEEPAVSERHRFGGTFDAIAMLNGRLVMLDWKSSNGVYSDYLAQLGAYRLLWEENHPSDLLTGAQLLRVGKEDGSWHHHSWTLDTLDHGQRMFLLLREAYDIEAQLKKAAA